MRRIALPLLACALALVGCSAEKTSPSQEAGHRPLPAPTVSVARRPLPPVVHTDAVLPTVRGDFGKKPVITVPKADPTGKFVVTPALTGHGREVADHDIAVVNYSARAWKAGKDLPATFAGAGKPAHPVLFTVGTGAVLPALDQAVRGQSVGSRVLVVAPPPAAYGSSGNPALGVSPTETVVFAVDIVDAVPAKATVPGRQHGAGAGLPSVRADASSVSLDVPDAAPPRDLVVRGLVDGSGPRVRAGQTVVLRRAGAVWNSNRGEDDVALFDTSWTTGPTPVVVGRHNLVEGLDRALVGATVGSRLLVVVPPALGYGSQAQQGIPARSSLVFVVDVLAAN
ncbi:FKBP-type peptidyl-prolyl cis-trans isomerase [Streptomyces sp. Ru71]|uniref:FKBP-type peptidyl-prolyl cis-trans isomerase n=1 Tax=Streptomyces sp. Ru71 TaxID=2080746 RepID=UPI0015E3F7C9|nr:FKBP-type peptidyl-prolyl cis-trans isomerase [Streptomyces sp. Ru71]